MKLRSIFLVVLVLTTIVWGGCGGGDDKEKRIREFELSKLKESEDRLDKLNEKYRDIPDERLMENNGANSAVYGELKERYKDYLTQLKTEVEATGAKFVVMIMKPIEKPGDAVMNFKVGRPYILSTCSKLGIDCYDLTDEINAQDPKVVTLLPRDGHWSKKGAEFFAGKFIPIVQKYMGNKSTAVFKPTERPETFGDLLPNQDEFLDGGKDIPYHLKANAQGLRMNYDLKFPKTKPRILFIGSSHIYNPFLDNDFIATKIVQDKLPETEILNAGMLSATIDDYLTLFKEKAKYAEPDVVILQTNGGDIIHLFFSNRNHLSRNKIPRNPTPLEEKYYHATYNY